MLGRSPQEVSRNFARLGEVRRDFIESLLRTSTYAGVLDGFPLGASLEKHLLEKFGRDPAHEAILNSAPAFDAMDRVDQQESLLRIRNGIGHRVGTLLLEGLFPSAIERILLIKLLLAFFPNGSGSLVDFVNSAGELSQYSEKHVAVARRFDELDEGRKERLLEEMGIRVDV